MRHVKILKALADPTRIRILEVLAEGERCACEIPGKVKKSQPNVSLHLKILRDAGILNSRKEGNKIFYSVAGQSVVRLLEEIKKMGRR
jgi:ArsR family transcriptional regulator